MRATIRIRPRFIQRRKFCAAIKVNAITLLWWVICADKPNSYPERLIRHESIHSWQQMVLFAIGIIICALTSFVLGVLGMSTPWWVWMFPVALPFALYALAWLIEVVLPPYSRAYYDTCFEREAFENDDNPDYTPTAWSVWKYILINRKK